MSEWSCPNCQYVVASQTGKVDSHCPQCESSLQRVESETEGLSQSEIEQIKADPTLELSDFEGYDD